jgi:hypothetical protein
MAKTNKRKTRRTNKATPKSGSAAKKTRGKERTTRRRRGTPRASFPSGSESVETVPSKRRRLTAPPGAGTGDLQGISIVEDADSESQKELIDEGQAFEAGIITGVEDARDEAEVRTHEVPQEDVPEEYQDKDRPNWWQCGA